MFKRFIIFVISTTIRKTIRSKVKYSHYGGFGKINPQLESELNYQIQEDDVITQTIGVGSTAIGRVVSWDSTTGILKYWQDNRVATSSTVATPPLYGYKLLRFANTLTNGGSFNISGGTINIGNALSADNSGVTMTQTVNISPTSGSIGNGNVSGSFSSVSSGSYGNGSSRINISSGSDIQFVRASSEKFKVTSIENRTFDDIRPSNDNSFDLGQSNRRFDDVFATNGTINTSDITLKDNVVTTDLGLDFLNDLTPIEFTWKDGGVRTHLGFSAQDIKEKLITHKGSDQNMAVYTQGSYETYYLKGEEDEFGSFDWTEQEVGEHDFERFGLRISELIPVLTKAIQELSAKNDALESRIAVLEG